MTNNQNGDSQADGHMTGDNLPSFPRHNARVAGIMTEIELLTLNEMAAMALEFTMLLAERIGLDPEARRSLAVALPANAVDALRALVGDAPAPTDPAQLDITELVTEADRANGAVRSAVEEIASELTAGISQGLDELGKPGARREWQPDPKPRARG